MNRLRNITYPLFLIACFYILILPFVFLSDAGLGGRQRTIVQAKSEDDKGLVFRLSEGSEIREEAKQEPRINAPKADALSNEETQSLLKRLPPLKSEKDDEKDFAMRDRSLPPPRKGRTISESFPPAGGATAPEQISSGPLEVLRFAPEGEVPTAPHLSITFSQPMVQVTSNSDLAALEAPVKLSPQPKGRWRWVGTKTLLFEPEGRFPMATNYTVEIPAGTKSISGGALAAAKRWTFSTPPLQIKEKFPSGEAISRNPIIFIEFNQRIDAQALLKFIELRSWDRETKLRLATAEEIAADEKARRPEEAANKVDIADKANKNFWIALRARGGDKPPLASDTRYTVTIKKGAPSGEGNRPTASPQSFTFHTYGALRLVEHKCGDQSGCEPGEWWRLQ
ncbi:MAG: Ig-like domain-containing protein, partial [Blastocatellia bacterium]|nr:Ig-like domain-containing protein [Blastocatellia bacterium]